MPDFGISTGSSRFGAQSLPAKPFGTPSLDTMVKGGPAFASAGNTPKKHCYEIFVAEIIKTKLEAPKGEQNPQAWGVDPKMSPKVQYINMMLKHAGSKIQISGHIFKMCHCADLHGITFGAVDTTEPGLLKLLGEGMGFRYDPVIRWNPLNPPLTCISKPSSYRCLTLIKVCGKYYQKEPCGRSTPTLEQLKTNPKTVKVCPCNDMKIISLAGVTSNTKEHTLSNGTKIKLKNPGNFEEVMKQIVEEEKEIKLKCADVWVADHPAKEPPEER